MPEPTQSYASALGRSVLLIEKYDVVATAIISALKQFAPAHRFQVASRLPEAERLAADAAPGLFVLDFDPPENGVIGFLTRMQSAHPATRVLVIAPGISREVALETAGVGAIQFLEKPFELTEFRDAVQGLLNLRTGRANQNQPKALPALHLVDLLHLMCSAGSSAVIVSETADGDSGEVHIRDGQICHAAFGNLTGLAALQTMFTWRRTRFSEGPKHAFSPRTIEGIWSEIVLEALRKAKVVEAQRATEPFSPQDANVVNITVGKKIVVIEDTEMLLVFLEAILRDADPTRQITTASGGMEGLKQAQRIDPDLILLDYCLPDIKGDEVCRSLLASEATARIPVLLMSGLVPEITAAVSRFENVVATIAKPFLSEQLLALVEKALAAGRIPAAKAAIASSGIPSPLGTEHTLPPAQRTDEMPVANGKHPGAQTSSPPCPISEQGAPSPNESPTAAFPQSVPVQPPLPRQISVKPAPTASRNEVIIALPLEVTAMQLGAFLKINAIRAKPLSAAVSFQILSAELRGVIPLETGFKLDSVTLDVDGRIAAARLAPTLSPIEPIAARGAFEIGHVSAAANDRIQLLSAATAPMTVQLVAHFQFSAVEVSKKFEITALVLRACHDFAAITLDQAGNISEESTIPCAISSIQLDSSSRIAELWLIPRIAPPEAALTSAR